MWEDYRLKVFLELSRLGSFTLAAKSLGISQPAVSQNISALEKNLGAKLFVRAKGDVFLTAEGVAFKAYAEKILYWYNAAGEMFGREGKLSMNRPIRIAADDVAASYLLPECLSALVAANPALSFELCGISPDEGIQGSVFEPGEEERPDSDEVPGTHFRRPSEADVEITVRRSPKTIDFEGEAKLVGVMEAAVVCSSSNLRLSDAISGKCRPFSTISGIHVSNRFAVWDDYKNVMTEDAVARTAIFSSSIETVKSMTGASPSLVGIVPSCSVRKEVACGELLSLPVPLPEFTYDIHFNPRPEFSGRKSCRLLLQTLKDSL